MYIHIYILLHHITSYIYTVHIYILYIYILYVGLSEHEGTSMNMMTCR